MIYQIFVNAIVVVIVIATTLIIASIGIGAIINALDGVREQRDDYRWRQHERLRARQQRKERLARNITELEDELGIGDKQ